MYLGNLLYNADMARGHHNVSTETIMVLSNGAETPSEWQFKLANFGADRSKQNPSEICQTYGA